MSIIAISFLVLLLFNIIKGEFVLGKLQQNLYNEDSKYLNWIFENKKITFFSLDFLALICLVVAKCSTKQLVLPMILLSFAFYFLEACRILSLKQTEISNQKFILSKRMKRLIVTLSIFYIIPLVFYLINYENGTLALIIEGLFTYFLYYLAFICKFLNAPIEKWMNHYNYEKAKEKIESMKNLEVVGITGSYGKSSTKQIVNTVLSEQSLCQMTPKNLNTIHGLVTTINNYLDQNEKYFIVEMGSYKSGEVSTICSLAKPKYAILTNIETINLESFGTMEDAIKAKFELIESLDEDGIAILNKDDYRQVEHVVKSPCKKVWVSIEQEADYMATDIKYSKEGTSFIFHSKSSGENYKVETRLLGKHNVYHILSTMALAKEMGISDEKIKSALSKLRPLENHLEIQNYGYMHQINNTHRSNPQGASNALEVLHLMPGTRVVVTTGMQTLGEKNNEFNNIFGSQVAKVADYVILIGEKSTKSVFKGLMESGFNQKKVYIVNRVSDAYTLLQEIKTKKEIYALFESDEDLKD